MAGSSSKTTIRELVQAGNVEGLRLRGNEHFKAKQWVDSIDCYTAGLGISPDHAILLLNRAATYSYLGKHDLALADASAATVLKPTAKGYLRKGRALVSLHRFQAAVDAYAAGVLLPQGKGLATDSSAALIAQEQHAASGGDISEGERDPEVLNEWGKEASKASRWTVAKAFFTHAIEQEPDSAMFYSNRSATNLNLKLWQSALDDAEECLRLDPHYVKGHARKAAALYGLGRFDEALLAYKHGAKVDSTNSVHQQGITKIEGIWRENKSKHSAVIEYLQDSGHSFDTLTKGAMNSAALKQQGNDNLAAKKLKCAIADYTKALLLRPRDHLIYSNRSHVFATDEEYDLALADAESCIQIEPTWSKGWSRKGFALRRLEKYKESHAAYEKALSLNPSNTALINIVKEVNDLRIAELEEYECAVCGGVAEDACSRCMATHYCSSAHQKRHWKESHRDVCIKI